MRKRKVGGKERPGGGGWMREKFKFDAKVVKGIITRNFKCLILMFLIGYMCSITYGKSVLISYKNAQMCLNTVTSYAMRSIHTLNLRQLHYLKKRHTVMCLNCELRVSCSLGVFNYPDTLR